MQDALPIVIVVVVIVAGIVAVATLLMGRGAYDHIGRSDMSFDRESAIQGDDPLRDVEIRQMLEARNARRVRRGQEPLDVETELTALRRPAVDPALLAEIRELVEARNARRARQGKPPLDVEQEIRRQLRDLG